jgi:hypothetical protein
MKKFFKPKVGNKKKKFLKILKHLQFVCSFLMAAINALHNDLFCLASIQVALNTMLPRRKGGRLHGDREEVAGTS